MCLVKTFSKNYLSHRILFSKIARIVVTEVSRTGRYLSVLNLHVCWPHWPGLIIGCENGRVCAYVLYYFRKSKGLA